jgi:hypothetical protein
VTQRRMIWSLKLKLTLTFRDGASPHEKPQPTQSAEPSAGSPCQPEHMVTWLTGEEKARKF